MLYAIIAVLVFSVSAGIFAALVSEKKILKDRGYGYQSSVTGALLGILLVSMFWVVALPSVAISGIVWYVVKQISNKGEVK